MTQPLPFIPYPSINKHGVIGDRRTAALVSCDGTVDWMCLPNYDSGSVFASILDAQRGGYWRLGPSVPVTGAQHYLENTPALCTTWTTNTGVMDLTDVMAWPQDDRLAHERDRRVLVRRLRCIRGEMAYAMYLSPCYDFDASATISTASDTCVSLSLGGHTLGLWSSIPVTITKDSVQASGSLRVGEELWVALSLNEAPEDWSINKVYEAFDDSVGYWRNWLGGLDYMGARNEQMRRSALMLHLLGYAPEGSMVAAPTTSLPERIGGEHNYDYRYAWVRDASLSVAGLSLLGDSATATRYLEWLAGLKSSSEMPMQVAYTIDGNTDLHERHRTDLSGYRGSLPVRLGNRAFAQIQLGSLGYLADCALIHLERAQSWKHDYWEMIRRIADFTTSHWHESDSGVWELPTKEQYVSSKVMSWVVVDRAIQIAEHTGHAIEHADMIEQWRQARDAIHADVMKNGWSERQQSFVQRYGADALDAACLLIPVMGFLPPNHPRVRATVDRVVESLTIDGFVYRFQPLETPVNRKLPMGEFEGAFLPCTFWLATAYAMQGRISESEAILERAEALSGDLQLFSEEADARNGEMLGNYPLLFSQVEYIRAVLALSKAKSTHHSLLTTTGHGRHQSAPDEPSAHHKGRNPQPAHR